MIVGLIIVFVLCIFLAVEAFLLLQRVRVLEDKLRIIRATNKAKIEAEISKTSGEQENKTENDLLGIGFPPPIVSLPKNFTFQKKKVDKRIKKQHNKKVK